MADMATRMSTVAMELGAMIPMALTWTCTSTRRETCWRSGNHSRRGRRQTSLISGSEFLISCISRCSIRSRTHLHRNPVTLACIYGRCSWRSSHVLFKLKEHWRALGLPPAARAWDNQAILHYFRVQQDKALAFSSGLHPRLGSASCVSLLPEHVVVALVDDVMGRDVVRDLWKKSRCEGQGGETRVP